LSKMFKSILTLDLARRFGFCKWAVGQRPTIGTYKLPAPDAQRGIGNYLAAYADWLEKVIKTEGVDFVCFERQILNHAGAKMTGFETAYQLMNLGGQTEKICFDHDIRCATVQVKEWRKHYLGNAGYSTKRAKELAMQKAISSGFNPQHDDAAEALGIADYVAEMCGIKRDWPIGCVFGKLSL